MSNNNKNCIQQGVRQDDVTALVSVILSDDSMTLPMIPPPVARIIYTSALKLSFNVFYKSIGNLDGMDLVSSSTNMGGPTRALHLDRSNRNGGGPNSNSSNHNKQQWKSFQSTIDLKPLEALADSLLRNKAVNLTVVPDHVEKQVYVNSLKIIFWVLHLISSTVKVTFCGHTLSMDFGSTAVHSKQQCGTRSNNFTNTNNHNNIIKHISSWINPQTIQDFSEQATKLLMMDGTSPMAMFGSDGDDHSRDSGGGGVKMGLAWMRSSMNKVQHEMTQKLNTSLYGLILAIVDDLLKSTKIEVLSDEISLRVASSSPSSQTKIKPIAPATPNDRTRGGNDNVRKSHLNGSGVDDVSLAVQASLESLGFEEERALLGRRFQEMAPEERAVILKDLKHLV